MLRRVLVGALVPMALATPAAEAHKGNPNFISEVSAAPAGVEAEILSRDDRIQLRVEPGHEALALGYEDEPYLRFGADGTVEVNERSPAYYLNRDRFGDVEVPPEADPEAPPAWREVAAAGVYDWHDHRIHYMAQGEPPQVDDESVETKVFDWEVPLEVDGEPAAVTGTLTWIPDEGAASTGLIAGLGAAVAASFAFFVWRMGRRGRGGSDAEADEAW